MSVIPAKAGIQGHPMLENGSATEMPGFLLSQE